MNVHYMYAAIRDDQFLRADRARLEAMWTRYCQYADKNFKTEIRTDFVQRYWEMAVTLALLDSGFSVTSTDEGPDVVVNHADGSPAAYVEAIAPHGGKGADKVSEPQGRVFWVPHDDIILRYTSAISEKVNKYRKWKEEGSIDSNLPYVIALNEGGIPMSASVANSPRIVQALYGIGTTFVTLDSSSLTTVASGFKTKKTSQKKNGSDVLLDGFIADRLTEVSAILFACAPTDCIPDDIRKIMTLAHNFCALNPLAKGWLGQVSEIWYTGEKVERITY
jgi:hypothetical protein